MLLDVVTGDLAIKGVGVWFLTSKDPWRQKGSSLLPALPGAMLASGPETHSSGKQKAPLYSLGVLLSKPLILHVRTLNFRQKWIPQEKTPTGRIRTNNHHLLSTYRAIIKQPWKSDLPVTFLLAVRLRLGDTQLAWDHREKGARDRQTGHSRQAYHFYLYGIL